MPKKPQKKIPFSELPPDKQMEMANPELNPEMIADIEKLMNFFDQYGIDYSKFKPEFLSFITKKKAYPNYDQYQYIPSQHDIKKWLFAVKDIYYKKKGGFPYREAVKQATQGWPKTEIYDFLNWLKFYEEGAHMKYKFAQVWYENGQPGYFLHIKPDVSKEEPSVDHQAVDDVRESAERLEEKKQIINRQRSKIIGRLDSAEKLLRSPEGQMFAGDELESLMEAIYNLKKKVQLVNKLSVSTRLYEDMIIREANILKHNGFIKAAETLYSIAQTPAQSGESATGTANGIIPTDSSPPPDPSGAGQSGTMSGLPATVPGTPNVQTPVDGDQNKDQPPVTSLPTETPQPEGIREFIRNMNEGNKADDDLDVSDQEEELMVSEAQIAPTPRVPPAVLEDIPMTDTPAPDRNPPTFIPPAVKKEKSKETIAPEEPLEVTEDDIKTPVVDSPSGGDISSLDNKLDATFDSVTMEEIVAELEDISKYYKVREMPRRLARIDMMFDSKGISAFFPALAEAQNKALEANNYIATRIDDILSKVRGSMTSENMSAKLKQDEDKEKQRKQMKKDQETAELEGRGKETPEIELGELGAPTTPPAPPARAVPRPVG